MELSSDITYEIAKELKEEELDWKDMDYYQIAYNLWMESSCYLVWRFKQEKENPNSFAKLLIKKIGDQYAYTFPDWEYDEAINNWLDAWGQIMREVGDYDVEVSYNNGNMVLIGGKPEEMGETIKVIDEERRRRALGMESELSFPINI